MKNEDLMLRQKHLIARSAQLRTLISEQTKVLKRPLALVDQASVALQWFYRNPKWPLAAVLIIAVLRPRKTIVWTSRLWGAWTTLHRVKVLIEKLPVQRFTP